MHELGHKYYYDAIETLEKKKNISYNKVQRILDDAIMVEISQLRKEKGFEIERDISKYAEKGFRKHDITEIIAEAYASADINIYSRRLLQLIKGLIKNEDTTK